MDPHSFCDLHDEQLWQEIRLLGDLVLAASVLTRHLTQDEVDQVLEKHEASSEALCQPDPSAHRAAG